MFYSWKNFFLPYFYKLSFLAFFFRPSTHHMILYCRRKDYSVRNNQESLQYNNLANFLGFDSLIDINSFIWKYKSWLPHDLVAKCCEKYTRKESFSQQKNAPRGFFTNLKRGCSYIMSTSESWQLNVSKLVYFSRWIFFNISTNCLFNTIEEKKKNLQSSIFYWRKITDQKS